MKLNFSIVVVNCNGREYINKCIQSIIDSNSRDFEIIVVDNGSSDGSVDFIKRKYASLEERFKIVALDKNYGPSKARNEGVKNVKGKYICFLDNDTEVHPNWAIEAINEFEKNDKIGIIQCKLLLAKERNKIDYVGEYLGQNGFLVQRAFGGEIDKKQYDQNVEILAAKSAGMFIRKDVFDKIGGFDDDYFIYVEETDLGWRSWLAGYKNIFVHKSVVYHEFGTSSITLGKKISSFNAKFHGSKNYILTLFKNLEIKNFLIILVPHIILWVGLAFYNLTKGKFKECYWIFLGIIWNIGNLSKNIKKRKIVQKMRIKNDEQLFKIFMRKMPIFYFLNKAIIKHKVGNAESF